MQTGTVRIGLALSGGGYRAAAFAAGAVLALLDAGLLKNIQTITSSSGGSLINAAVARGRLASLSEGASEVEEVRSAIRRVVSKIENQSISPYRLRRTAVYSLVLVTATVVAMIRSSDLFFAIASAVVGIFGIVMIVINLLPLSKTGANGNYSVVPGSWAW
jgi:predicted acylesterase/phospholipase RssA